MSALQSISRRRLSSCISQAERLIGRRGGCLPVLHLNFVGKCEKRSFSTTNPFDGPESRNVVRRRHMPQIHRVIRTLIPDKMSQLGQEVYDLSGWKGTRFSFDGSVPQNDRRGSENSSAGLTYRNQTANGLRVSVPFPKNTRGVLYLHLPSGHSDISAQIRFRICDDVASFKQGVDLRNDITEEPWSVSLYSIAKFRRYNAFLRLLLEQGLVDVDLISDIRNLPFRRLSSCLYDLNQPFIFDVSVNAPQFSLMTRRSLEIIRLFGLLRDDRPTMDIHQTPYTGLIRVCFELSTLPEHVAEGPTLLLRILDIIKPVQCVIEGYDNYIAFPEAETFVSKMSKKTGQYRPWHYPLNSRAFGGAFYTFIQNSKSMRGHNDTPRLKSSTSV